MIHFLLRRLLGSVPVVLGVALAVFLLLHLVPGDPVELMLGDSARPADRSVLRQALGLDRSLGEQLLGYFGGLAQGDLGQSLFSRRPVAEIIAERLPATLELAAAALAFALLTAIPLGLTAARHKGRAADTGSAAAPARSPWWTSSARWTSPSTRRAAAVGRTARARSAASPTTCGRTSAPRYTIS